MSRGQRTNVVAIDAKVVLQCISDRRGVRSRSVSRFNALGGGVHVGPLQMSIKNLLHKKYSISW